MKRLERLFRFLKKIAPPRRHVEIGAGAVFAIVVLFVAQYWYKTYAELEQQRFMASVVVGGDQIAVRDAQRARIETGPMPIDRAMRTLAQAERSRLAAVRPEASSDPAPAAGWMGHPDYVPPPPPVADEPVPAEDAPGPGEAPGEPTEQPAEGAPDEPETPPAEEPDTAPSPPPAGQPAPAPPPPPSGSTPEPEVPEAVAPPAPRPPVPRERAPIKRRPAVVRDPGFGGDAPTMEAPAPTMEVEPPPPEQSP
jgi:hypothetical protein